MSARTLFEKIWSRHEIIRREDGASLLYVTRHYLHDGSHNAFRLLHGRGLNIRRPDRTVAVPDHYVGTDSGRGGVNTHREHANLVATLSENAGRAGVPVFGLDDRRQGIVHVVGPEQGLSLPGSVIVCGDSHTSTHGALGALAFGIGSSEAAHVMATQALWQKRPETMRVRFEGKLGPGVCAKDLVLALIAQIGANGATGHVIEYGGPAIRALSMEGRLTVCNMSIEAGARAGMVAPDEVTYAYLRDKPYAPSGAAWDAALVRWRSLATDEGATFNRELVIDASAIEPMVSWGTSPEDAMPITACVPDPATAASAQQRQDKTRALEYMGLRPGEPLAGIKVDRVFIGSCTNSRIEDLRAAAHVLRGRRVVVSTWVVPGSRLVKSQAEAEGLDRVFLEANAQWREPGCSLCPAMNGDIGEPGQRIVSTSNRNFVGRQGPSVRTHLAGPAMAAAAAVTGRLVDVRTLIA
ncbi:3-isopropylmalate dehydratase large subunit [Rhodococcus sp. SRB_17]|uniref:3-isopropylmalate dehydratase large subunit n=1 Tax=Acidovorax sp. SRB_24 TaxID=1962700 RepID=UPI00145DE72C|nr:3-isopropylmalate dehydratase large subunit [Acidovorax sp. SRB_24]NMM92093.1 3-isopropylmalate dehydratase large subunit [Rhodococcus sp. SRB_17]